MAHMAHATVSGKRDGAEGTKRSTMDAEVRKVGMKSEVIQVVYVVAVDEIVVVLREIVVMMEGSDEANGVQDGIEVPLIQANDVKANVNGELMKDLDGVLEKKAENAAEGFSELEDGMVRRMDEREVERGETLAEVLQNAGDGVTKAVTLAVDRWVGRALEGVERRTETSAGLMAQVEVTRIVGKDGGGEVREETQ